MSQCDSLEQAYYNDKVFIISQDSVITYLRTSYLQCDTERVSNYNANVINRNKLVKLQKSTRQRNVYFLGGGLIVGLIIGILVAK